MVRMVHRHFNLTVLLILVLGFLIVNFFPYPKAFSAKQMTPDELEKGGCGTDLNPEGLEFQEEGLKLLAPDEMGKLPDGEKWEEATLEFKEALTFEPRLVPSYINLATYYTAKNEPSKAIQILKKGLKHCPNSRALYFPLGNAYARNSQHHLAIVTFEKVKHWASYKDNPSLYLNLGNSYTAIGKYAQAIKFYQKAVELNPGNEKAWNNMMFANLMLGNKSKAVEIAKKVDKKIQIEQASQLISIISDEKTSKETRNNLLLGAVKSGNANMVSLLLDSGANVDATNQKGETALFLAVFRERLNIVKILVDAGADMYKENTYGNTPLSWASGMRHGSDFVKTLVDGGVNVDWQGEDGGDKTPLMIASADMGTEGYIDTVRVLLDAGADVNLRDREGRTALIWTSRWTGLLGESNIDIVNALLDAGAEVNVQDHEGTTALMRACKTIGGGNDDVVKALLDAGADVNLRDKEGMTAIIHCQVSSSYRNHDIIKILEKAGAQKLPEKTITTMNLLDAAKRGDKLMISAILMDGADVNARGKTRGETPLIVAILSKQLGTIDHLIEVGADVNVADDEGWTPLMVASAMGRVDIIKTLLKAKATVNKNSNGMTALYLAIREGRKEAVQLLIDAGADVNAEDGEGWMPLMVATAKKHPNIAKILVQAGADINWQDRNGLTALMVAASMGSTDLTRLLLGAGADICLKDNKLNATAVGFAIKFPELAKLLEKHKKTSNCLN